MSWYTTSLCYVARKRKQEVIKIFFNPTAPLLRTILPYHKRAGILLAPEL